MVDPEIKDAVCHARCFVWLSCAGQADPQSDVDLVVIVPGFDEPYDKRRVNLLWASCADGQPH